MKNIFAAIAFSSGLLAATVSSAATLGLATTGPVSSGTGAAEYSEVLPTATFTELLGTFPTFGSGPLSGTDVSWLWEGDLMPAVAGFDTVTIGLEIYDIEEVGFTESGTDDQIEFKLGSGTTFADGALFILKGGFDFSILDPFDQFSTDLLGICDPLSDPLCDPFLSLDVEFSVQALDPGTEVIPLPAPALLLGSAMAGLFVARRRRRT